MILQQTILVAEGVILLQNRIVNNAMDTMGTEIDFRSLAGEKSNLELLQQLHTAILRTNKNIEYRIFPIYVRYDNGDKTIAVLRFKVNFKKINITEPGELELGLNIGDTKLPKGFDTGESLKYPGINCSIKLNTSSHLTKKLLDAIKLTKQ